MERLKFKIAIAFFAIHAKLRLQFPIEMAISLLSFAKNNKDFEAVMRVILREGSRKDKYYFENEILFKLLGLDEERYYVDPAVVFKVLKYCFVQGNYDDVTCNIADKLLAKSITAIYGRTYLTGKKSAIKYLSTFNPKDLVSSLFIFYFIHKFQQTPSAKLQVVRLINEILDRLDFIKVSDAIDLLTADSVVYGFIEKELPDLKQRLLRNIARYGDHAEQKIVKKLRRDLLLELNRFINLYRNTQVIKPKKRSWRP